MLMRDYSYHIYRSLYSCLEVTDTSNEPLSANTQLSTNEQETNHEAKQEEQVETMATDNDDVPVIDLDTNAEDNEKKRKRTPSQVRELLSINKKIGELCLI